MKSVNKKSAGGKPLCTKLGLIVALTVLVLVAVAPMAAGEWYFKPAYPNYAPSGMPDFNQTQDNWKNPGGQWSFCGPVAVANCFWWFDSKYANQSGTPGDSVDTFPLVQNYFAPYPVWSQDDHDPANVDDGTTSPGPNGELVERLAWCMDTDGMRTGSPHSGTDVHEMEQCINDWLNATGLNKTFYEHTVKMPDFYYIEEEIKRCQDVILLLGFWEHHEPEGWVRIGGHYVTCAGVDSENETIALSDPFFDNAEAGGPGRVLPGPHGYPHGPTVHNDARNVSHDYYEVLHVPDPGGSPEMSPGGSWELIDYANESGYPPEWVWNFMGLNCPEEFELMQGEWLSGPIKTEIEYAVLISPLVLTPFLISGWVNCTDGDPVNGPIVTVTNLNTSEVFIAETNASSNYYQVLTSSLNVSAGDVLHFVVSDGNGNSTEFNHPVTNNEMYYGGFEQNISIVCGGGGPTPFRINGWVNCTDSSPVNDPSVTVTNLNTSEAFTAQTNVSSNYYHVMTSSYNVSAGNVLHFDVSKSGSSDVFNHTVTAAEMNAGGFMQNATIGCEEPTGTCGDVDGWEGVSPNDGWLVFMNATSLPGDPRYQLTSTWAADCDGWAGISPNDGWLIFMNATSLPGDPRYILQCA